jgi:plasmid replication initiation protein
MTAEKAVTVVQSNKLIEARYSLTVGEARLILAMVSHIKPNDTDLAEYKIPLAELARMFDLAPSNIYGDIDQITDKLMSRVLRIRQENGRILKIQWICRAVHDTGSVTLSFVPDLKPYLLLLKREFTIIDLDAVKDFQSIYSIRLYQLLKQYLSIGWREFGLDELKEILGLESDQYQVFSDFKKRVLTQAQKEMEAKNSKCDLTFQLETLKEGKKITRLRFIIVKRPVEQSQTAKPVQKKAPAAKKHPPLSAEMQEFEQWLKKNDAFMYGFMQEHGPNALMVQAEYRKFLERREEALQG